MKQEHNHSFNPDREAIKMRYFYQFIETDSCYILVLNEDDDSVYPKSKYSKQAAEDEASDTVAQSRKRHGANNVYYDGVNIPLHTN